MRTDDFCAAPPLARGGAMVTIEAPEAGRGTARWALRARSLLRRRRGLVRRAVLLDRARPRGLIAWFADAEQADAAVAALGRGPGHGRVPTHLAQPHGYSNGVWRAEGNVMAHIPRFSRLTGEERATRRRR